MLSMTLNNLKKNQLMTITEVNNERLINLGVVPGLTASIKQRLFCGCTIIANFGTFELAMDKSVAECIKGEKYGNTL